jgi:hypothetical protein
MIRSMARTSRLLFVLLAAAVLIGAAVAAVRTEAALSIETALQASLDNGFDAVIWEPTPEMQREAEKFGEITGQELVVGGAGQIVIPRGRRITDVEQPLLITWYPSKGRAVRRIEADRPLFEGRLTADERAGLPRDFDVTRLAERRVCNLVVASYDDDNDPSLPRRVQALIGDLQDRC